MGFSRALKYFNNAGSPTGDQAVGPLNVTSMSKLFAAKVTGSILGGYTSIPPGAATDNAVFIGVQWVSHGSTPLSVVTQSTSSNFLKVRQMSQENMVSTWAPDSGNAEFGIWSGIDLDWRGQLPLGSNIDFWFSMGQTIGTTFTWAAAGAIEIVYT